MIVNYQKEGFLRAIPQSFFPALLLAHGKTSS